MGKHINEYPPMALLKEVSRACPKAWDYMAYFHGQNGIGSFPSWPAWCYVPMAAACDIASSGSTTEPISLEAVRMAQCIAALAPWRLSKEVYVIDLNLAAALYEQGDDLDIPGEFLLNLPYLAFYVEAPFELNGCAYHGFIVHLEYDLNNGDRELRFLYVPSRVTDPTFGFPLHIDEKTLSECVNHMMSEAARHVAESSDPAERRDFEAALRNQDTAFDILKKSLQIVLYLLAVNAEIAPDPEQSTVTRRSKTVRDQYREVRKWDVGYRTGAAIRAQRSKVSAGGEDKGGSHASPRPHLRRAHWHHFWTGPKSDSSQRKLVLKWLPPIAIGTSDEDVVVFRHVK